MRIPALQIPLVLAAFGLSVAHPAQAELSACNESDGNISVAIGYKDSDWTSEGWWTMLPGECKVMVSGDLKMRYYYWRATQDGVVLPSENYKFCTSREVFTIVGDSECEARGYDTATFTEVDTGDAKSYTINVRGSSRAKRSAAEEYSDVGTVIQGEWYAPSMMDFRVSIQGDRMVVADANGKLDPATFEIAQVCPQSDGSGPVLLMNHSGFDACWRVVVTGRDQIDLHIYDTGADVQLRRQGT